MGGQSDVKRGGNGFEETPPQLKVDLSHTRKRWSVGSADQGHLIFKLLLVIKALPPCWRLFPVHCSGMIAECLELFQNKTKQDSSKRFGCWPHLLFTGICPTAAISEITAF